MELTIYSTPTDYPHGKFQFLQWGNFLGEFKTEIDKARARANLGIPDSYSFNWGNIGGNINRQQDLINLINQVVAGNTQDYTTLTADVADFRTLLNNYSSKLLSVETTVTGLKNMADAVDMQNIRSEILSLKINVAQNSTDISRLSEITSGGEVVDLVALLSRVNNIEGTITAHGVQIAAKADQSIVATKADLSAVTALESRMNTYQSSLSSLESRITAVESYTGVKTLIRIEANQSIINATEGDNDKPIIINGIYSDNSSVNITQYVSGTSSNDSVVSYTNNGYLQIKGLGSAIITFTYNGQSVTVSVNVAESGTPVVQDKFYIGYITNIATLFTSKYEKTSINGTWNNDNIPKQIDDLNGGFVSFAVAIPSKYTNVSIIQAGLPVIEGSLTNEANGVTYNIYYTTVNSYGNEFNITIS